MYGPDQFNIRCLTTLVTSYYCYTS